MATCSWCNGYSPNGVCTNLSCKKCPEQRWQQILAREQNDLKYHMRMNLLTDQYRELVWRDGVLKDSFRGDYSYREYGVHNLPHYIETRIVYPMGPQNDPDLQAFKAYRGFQYASTPMSQVFASIENQYNIQEAFFYNRVEEIPNVEPYSSKTPF